MFLCVDDRVLYIRSLKASTTKKNLELISIVSKMVRCKINIQLCGSFLNVSYKEAEEETGKNLIHDYLNKIK